MAGCPPSKITTELRILFETAIIESLWKDALWGYRKRETFVQ